MRRTRRSFTPEEKAKIVIEVLREEKSLNEIAVLTTGSIIQKARAQKEEEALKEVNDEKQNKII